MREWRRASNRVAATADAEERLDALWRADGEATCAAVYGTMYERLRANIRELHPALDEWMITEGYGKVLSRPGLDLARRELCIVAACAARGQDRQLHSHLHGALNVGCLTGVRSDDALRIVAPTTSVRESQPPLRSLVGAGAPRSDDRSSIASSST